MKVARWLFAGLVTLTALVVITFGVALLALDDEQWTGLFLRTVDRFAAERYEVSGEFVVSMKGGPAIRARHVSIAARDGSFEFSADEADARLDLWALRHRALLIEKLNLERGALHLRVDRGGEADDRGNPWALLPVVGEGLVQQLSVVFENEDGATTVVDVASLALAEDRASGLVNVKGYGTVDETAFSLAGELGGVAALTAPPPDGYPIAMTLTSRAVQMGLTGKVARPISGRGIDVMVSVAAPSIDHLVDVWLPAGVSLGTVDGRAHVYGSVRDLSVDQLVLKLDAADRLVIDVSGKVADVLDLGGIDLTGMVRIQDRNLLEGMLPEGLESIDRVVGKAVVSGDARSLALDDFGLVATSRLGDAVRLDGAATIDFEQSEARVALALKGEAEARSGGLSPGRFQQFVYALDSVDLVLDATIRPESAALKGLSLTLGRADEAQVAVSGSLDVLPFAEGHWYDGLDVQVGFETRDLGRLVGALGMELTTAARAEGSARLRGAGRNTSIHDLDVSVHFADTASATVAGSGVLDFSAPRFVNRLDLEVSGEASEIAPLLGEIGAGFPALGRAELAGRLTGQGGRLELTSLNLAAPELGINIESSGVIDLSDETHLSVGAEMTIAESTRLLAPFGIETQGDLGGLAAKVQASGSWHDLSVEEMLLVSTGAGPLVVDASGVVDHVRLADKPRLEAFAMDARLGTPSISQIGAVFGLELPDLGAADAELVINDLDGSLGAESVVVRVTQGDAEVIRAEGRIDDLLRRSEIGWDISFDLDLTPLVAHLTGVTLPGLGRVQAEVELSDADGSLGAERIEMSSNEGQPVVINGNARFDDFAGADELEVTASVGIGEPGLIGQLLGVDIEGASPVAVQGTFTGSLDRQAIEASVKVGNTEFVTSGRFRMGDKPRLELDVTAETLYVEDFGAFAAAGDETEAAIEQAGGTGPVFSSTPFAFTALDAFDLDLALSVDEVVLDTDGHGIDSLELRVVLEDGELNVEPIRALYADGGLSGRFRLTRLPEPAFVLDLEGNDVYLGYVLRQLRGMSTIRGVVTMDVSLRSRGTSAREMAANLNGNIGVAMEDGRIPRRLVDRISLDVLGWTLSSTAARGRSQVLHCGITRLDITQGLVNVESFFLDGPGLRLMASGHVDLTDESLDLVLVPQRRRRIWSAADPVRIRGSMRQPRVSAVPARTAAREIGTFALTGPIYFLSVRALGYLFGMVADEDAAGSACFVEPTGAEDDSAKGPSDSPDPRGDIE